MFRSVFQQASLLRSSSSLRVMTAQVRAMSKSLYDFTVKDLNGNEMNDLLDKYGSKGLVILGFPCNQFGHQENTANEEILNSLKYVRPGKNFVPKMEILAKLEVNGEKADPLFVYLKEELPVTHPDGPNGLLMQDQRSIIWNPVRRSDISWNFEKFLIDRGGKPYQRYNRHFETKDIANDIEKLLN